MIFFLFYIIFIDNTFLLHFLYVWNVSSDAAVISHSHNRIRFVFSYVFFFYAILGAPCQTEMLLNVRIISVISNGHSAWRHKCFSNLSDQPYMH